MQDRAIAQLEASKHRSAEMRENSHNYLLRGIIRRGECGLSYGGRASTARGKKYRYYTCASNRSIRGPASSSHPAPNINADRLEEEVWVNVRAFLADPGETLRRVREQRNAGGRGELEGRLAAKQKEQVKVETEIDNLLDSIAHGVSAHRVGPQIAAREQRIEYLSQRIEEIEGEIAHFEAEEERAESAEAWLMTLRDRLAEIEEDAPEAYLERRELVKLLVKSVTVESDGSVQVCYRFGPPPTVQRDDGDDLVVSSRRNSLE